MCTVFMFFTLPRDTFLKREALFLERMIYVFLWNVSADFHATFVTGAFWVTEMSFFSFWRSKVIKIAGICSVTKYSTVLQFHECFL